MDQPLRVELLADEVMNPTQISEALAEAIGTEEGWNNILARFDRIIELFAMAKDIEALMERRTPNKQKAPAKTKNKK